MMARHRLQDQTDDGSSRYMDVPLRDQYSEPLWLPQTVGGPQNFHAPQAQSGTSKGYQNSHTGVRSRTSQNGTPPGLDDSPFYGNISHQWNQTPPYTMDEPLYSKTSLETMVSNTDLASGSDQPGTLDSYSVSSDHLDTLDCSSSLSGTGLYTDNTNFVKNEFSELQFLDEEDTRTGAFHTGLSNGVPQSPSHMVPIANGSPSHIFAMGADETIYTTGSEIMPHSVVTSGAHTGDYNPEFSWMTGDHAGPKVSSPTYSISGLSIPMSRRSSARDALPAFNGHSPRFVHPLPCALRSPLNTFPTIRSSRKSMVPNNRIDEDSYLKFAEPLEFFEDRFSDRGRRNGETSELDNVARDHPYYHSAVLGPDRLYHCPWESMNPPCNHKPEKLKCNYEYDFILSLLCMFLY